VGRFLDHPLSQRSKQLYALVIREMTLYDRLGIQRGAGADEIKKAYRKMALTHHPDKGGNAEEFREIQKAYEILSDDRKRSIYDQTGQEMNDAVQDHSEGMPFGGMPFGGGIPFDMGNLFGMFGQRGGPGPQGPQGQKAPPKIHELPISLWDFYHGKQIRIQFERQKFCKDCAGSGAASHETCGGCGGSGSKQQMMMIGPGMNVLMRGPCDHCAGAGKRVASICNTCAGKKTVTQEKALDFKIEPGMYPGTILKFANECSDQAEYVEPGDVHIHLHEADEAIRFKRLGRDDLQVSTQIGLKDSLLGCEERMQTHPAHPQGLVIEIPVGVQNGEVIRLVGEGMPRRGGGRGDLHITVAVVASAAEKALLVKGREALESVFSNA
jgi:DnaJ-class molecular chaperone